MAWLGPGVGNCVRYVGSQRLAGSADTPQPNALALCPGQARPTPATAQRGKSDAGPMLYNSHSKRGAVTRVRAGKKPDAKTAKALVDLFETAHKMLSEMQESDRAAGAKEGTNGE